MPAAAGRNGPARCCFYETRFGKNMIPENVFFTHMWYNNHMLTKKSESSRFRGYVRKSDTRLYHMLDRKRDFYVQDFQ